MKKITFVGDLNPSSIVFGELKDKDGKPPIWTHKEFLLGRIIDAKFASTKEGIDAVIFVMKAKLEIENQEAMAKHRGFWLLEDDRASAILESTKHPQNAYIAEFSETIMKMVQPILDMTEAE